MQHIYNATYIGWNFLADLSFYVIRWFSVLGCARDIYNLLTPPKTESPTEGDLLCVFYVNVRAVIRCKSWITDMGDLTVVTMENYVSCTNKFMVTVFLFLMYMIWWEGKLCLVVVNKSSDNDELMWKWF